MESLFEASGSNSFTDLPVEQLVKTDLYQTYPCLEGSNEQWNNIISQATDISIPAGTILMHPGSACMQFMLLIDGCVRVYQQTPSDREVTLYRTHGGELCVLSVNGMMKQKNFGAFAKTETDITAVALSRDQFLQAMAVHEPFREFMLISLTSRFHNVLELMEETVFESLDTRLICMLARLSKENNNNLIQITHEKLARELGSTREVISRLLKVLERQGCIKLGRGEIHILI